MWKVKSVGMGICQVLAVLGFGMLFLLARPAWAVWGDYDDPMPILFGMELGADIRKYPELAKLYTGQDSRFPEHKDQGLRYEGIPVYYVGYGTYNDKISVIGFSIKSEDFSRFREIMRIKFGNERVFTDKSNLAFRPGYYWGKYEVEIKAPLDIPTSKSGSVYFVYLPLRGLEKVDAAGTRRNFKYQGVTLARKVKNYPFLYPAAEESPDIVYYKTKNPPKVFEYDYGPSTHVESETWLAYKGFIYSLELRGDTSKEHFLEREMSQMYKLYVPYYDLYSSEVRIGDYTLYFKEPGLTVLTHMPTYWRMLRAKAKLERGYLEVKP